jgi:asparagine synthase (glutamine-hydrolysing)
MCGISGLFSVAPLEPAKERAGLDRMQRSLQHRGPDGSGQRVFSHAALVHNRLAIIDLDTGEQPLMNRAGDICIVFNGEIYNYRELRAQYSGYPFQTQSDTEVIVAAYVTDGIAGFGKLRGMYAFSLWDERKKTGLLVRDPVGIKPLFYSQNGGRLLFGSEAKAILAQCNTATLDTESLHHLMNFRYVVGNSSLFQGVQQVPPGSVISWHQGKCRQITLEQARPALPNTLSDVMQLAVERHLVSDVPVGCYLSGGIDSAIVAHLASFKKQISSFTLDVGDDPSESRHAAETARWLKIPNRQQVFHLDDSVTLHRSLIRHLEAPKVNALQSAILAKFAASHVKVALSGLGGDELFYGYNAHRIMWSAQLARRLVPGAMNSMLASALQRALPSSPVWNEPQRAVAMLGAMPEWSRVYGILRNVWDCPQMRCVIYGEKMLDSAPEDSFAWLGREFADDVDAVEAVQRFEFRNKMVNDLLWHEDRVSMRVGLEVRVPFLDWELVRFVGNQSRQQLMPYGAKKFALKEYAKTIVPASILKRKKSGFQLNITEVFDTVLKPVITEYLSEERLRRHQLFNPRFVQEVLRHPGQSSWRWHYFMLYLMAQTHMLVEEFDVA